MSYPSLVTMSDIPLFMTQGYIMNVMQKLGHHPVRATISKDKRASDKAVCMVQFANVDAAREAVLQLNGKSVSISGSGSTATTFKLTQGTENNHKLYNVFVGELAPEIDDFRLFKFFGDRFKSLCDAKVIVDGDGKSRGFGFLAFTSEEDQKFCVKIMDGSLDLGNRAIKVSTAVAGPPMPPVDVYALGIMSGDPWCRYTSWNQFVEPAEYPFISVKVNLTAWKEGNDGKEIKESKDSKIGKDDASLVKYNVTSNTNYLNHETLEKDCHLWDALECSKWLPLMALNLPPSDYADPPAESEAQTPGRKLESNHSLNNGTVGDMKDDGKNKSLKRIIPSKSLTSKPSKVMKKTNGVAAENSVEDLLEPDSPAGDRKTSDAGTPSNNVSDAKAKLGFDSIGSDKTVTSPEDLSDLFPSNAPLSSIASDTKKLAEDVYWHVKLGHVSSTQLKALSKIDGRLKNIAFDNVAEECDVCKVAKVPDRFAKRQREMAKKPLENIHLHLIGPIVPVSKADGRRYVTVFVDEYSRLGTAYVLKSKSEIGDKFETFLKNARRELGTKAEVRYLRMYERIDFSGDHMKTVLDREDVNVQLTSSDMPALAKELAKVLQERIRSMMFDSRLPKKMWDLALATAVHVYNRTPHEALAFDAPYQKFAPKVQLEPLAFHRFGCVAYVKLAPKAQPPKETPAAAEAAAPMDVDDAPPGAEAPGDEAKPEDAKKADDEEAVDEDRKTLRCIFVGYTSSAFLLFHPESNLLTESSKVRCNEKIVYGDVYSKLPVKDVVVESVDSEWLKSLSVTDDDSSSSSRRDDYYKSSSKRRRY